MNFFLNLVYHIQCFVHSSFNYFFSFKSTLAIFMDVTNSFSGMGDEWHLLKQKGTQMGFQDIAIRRAMS